MINGRIHRLLSEESVKEESGLKLKVAERKCPPVGAPREKLLIVG